MAKVALCCFRIPDFLKHLSKGAPARESRTGTRLVSPAGGREKKKSDPTRIGLELRFYNN